MQISALPFSRSADAASPRVSVASSLRQQSSATNCSLRSPADWQHPRYRVFRALGLAALLGLSRPGLGQTAPAPTREDSVKGRIWTATARRIWADVKPKQPQPAPWATGAAFSDWALTTQADRSEIGLLRRDVIELIGKGQPHPPAEVASAIIAVINRKRQSKEGALARVNVTALSTSLAIFIPARVALHPQVIAGGDSDANDFVLTKPAIAEDEHPAPEVRAMPAAPAYTAQPLEPRYFGLPPALAGVALALLGALLGAGLANQLRPKRQRHRHLASSAPPPAEPENSSVMNSPEYRKLHKQYENLGKQLLQVQKQLAELRKKLPDAPTAAAPASAPAVAAPISNTSLQAAAAAAQASETLPTVAAPATPTETIAEAPDDALFSITLTVPKGTGAAKAAPAPPLPTATRYGPVQETPFLEERKIVDAPLPQLALMLTVNPHDATVATFTLNPSVDQARLIGDGLTRLQKFFDYDPPLGGRITLVSAAAAGQLQRHADGWQVVQRARLTIS